MMDRVAFIERVRRELRGVPAMPLPTERPRSFGSGDGPEGRQRFERFAAALEALGAVVRFAPTSKEVVGAVAELATSAQSAVVADDLGALREAVNAGLASGGCAVEPFSRDAAARVDLGVTSAVAAVASTGSLLIAGGDGSSRVASLLPPAHVAVIGESTLLPGFEELYELMPHVVADGRSAVMITGPSRTADIEMQVVRGVHGPGWLAVIVVGAA
jgi:L-lactate dehydrogenase complex protein LldG